MYDRKSGTSLDAARGYGTEAAMQVPEEVTIGHILKEQADLLDRVSMQLASLHERIGPVLKPDQMAPDQAYSKQPAPVHSGFYELVERHNMQLRVISAGINNLHDRVDR